MGKPTGFMEYKREKGKEQSPINRIKNWNEYSSKLTDEALTKTRCKMYGLWNSILSYGN